MTPQRLNVAYTIAWHGRWHVGSGYRSSSTHRLLRRVAGPRSAPFVPGSQVKGVLRHQCERLVQTFKMEAVDPHATSKDQERLLVHHFKPLVASTLMVDRLFGTRYQGDCLFVENAMLMTPSETRSSTQTRTAIDRVTGTIREHHLFTTEIAEAEEKLELCGTIRARHPSGILTQEDQDTFPHEYSLLVAGIMSIEALGGDKSTGLGQCSIRVSDGSLSWNGNPITLDFALKNLREPEWGEEIQMIRENES